MNRTDKVAALDRLRSDLSQDEVSMLIGIFGSTKQRDAMLPAEPVSRPSTCPAPPNQSQNTALPIAFSFDHHYHNVHNHFHPAIERPGLNRSGMVLRGRILPEVVTPPTIYQITQEAINILSQQNNPVPLLPLQMLGAPLSATLAKEQQMTNKRRKKDTLLPKPPPLLPWLATENKATPNIRNDEDRPPSLAPSPKKGTKPNVPRKAVLPRNANFASSATSTTTTTVTMRTKITSVQVKEPKADTTNKSPKVTQPVETYITRPRKMNKGVWTQRLEEAREFVLKHGHGRIPTTYPPNPDLANWAKRQRYHYKIFKKHVLDRPNNPAIAPTKFINTVRRNRMNNQHPNGCIRHNNTPGTRWIKCLMTSERFARLDAIGFCMDLQAGVWDCNYRRLCNYAMRNNGCTSPSKHTLKELWKWVGTQRYQMALRKKREEGNLNLPAVCPCLTPERIAKLNKISFVWDEKDERSRS
jgi:hypothetical protein